MIDQFDKAYQYFQKKADNDWDEWVEETALGILRDCLGKDSMREAVCRLLAVGAAAAVTEGRGLVISTLTYNKETKEIFVDWPSDWITLKASSSPDDPEDWGPFPENEDRYLLTWSYK